MTKGLLEQGMNLVALCPEPHVGGDDRVEGAGLELIEEAVGGARLQQEGRRSPAPRPCSARRRGVTSASKSSIMPRRTRGRAPCPAMVSSARAWSASLRMALARRRKISPAGVRVRGRSERLRRGAPTSRSRLVSCWLTVAGEVSSRRAAAETDASSAVATKTSISQSRDLALPLRHPASGPALSQARDNGAREQRAVSIAGAAAGA